jgi:Ca2+-binding EF-hand superfamily protein
MRKSLMLIIGVAGLAMAGTTLAAHDGKRAGRDRMAPIAKVDALAKANQRFELLDTNQDGMIDAAEMAAHQAKMQERRATRMAARAAAEATLSDEEKAQRQERRAQRQERWAKRGDSAGRGGGRGGMLARRDANQDGVISRDEFAAPVLRMFERLDTDGDGIITPAERAVAREARKARRT